MSKEAIKLAIEALKSISEMVDYEGNNFKLEYEIKALEEALTQEQGEPVAWVIWFCGYPAGFFEKETDAIEAFEQRNLDYPEESRKLLPLYTTPQQLTWVGLTDKEIDECDWGQSERDHARAIEAKLKDKNL